MIKAVFFDVDGTLLSHTRHQVSQSTREALRKLRQNKIQCVVATGRHLSEMEKLPVKGIDFDGYITLNGQLCLDSRKNILSAAPIVGGSKEQILRLFEEKRIPMMLVERDALYINFINQRVINAQAAISSELPQVGRYTGNDFYQAIAYIEKQEEEQFRILLPDCRITRWNDHGVDIISSRGGKTRGIAEYLSRTGIRREETMAFGDGENDVDMLRFVQTGIAMGNAEPEVKEAADYVTGSVDADGIESALRHFGLIE